MFGISSDMLTKLSPTNYGLEKRNTERPKRQSEIRSLNFNITGLTCALAYNKNRYWGRPHVGSGMYGSTAYAVGLVGFGAGLEELLRRAAS